MARTSSTLSTDRADAVLIGGGVASATLATLLAQVEPSWRVVVIEKLGGLGCESSDGWNNAGTGHSALCELNYTPESGDGSIDIAKAVSINEQFQISRQFWASLVKGGIIEDPSAFIRPVAHMSFVHGEKNVDYLRRRADALSAHPLFGHMQYSDDAEAIAEWAPLIARDRNANEPVAATYAPDGTDVDFGALTRALLNAASGASAEVRTGHEVVDIRRMGADWGIMTQTDSGTNVTRAPFVFVGAGGNALPLLQKSGIKEIRGYGGFPISGQWLRCTNSALVHEHSAKVYGKAAVGAPPMSVPHLDTRVINGRRELIFGPFAGWTPKFLKQGSWLDLPRSINRRNLPQMLAVAPPNIDLMVYLASELAKTHKQRVESLRDFMPSAADNDWELVTAGQRVQVIAPHPQRTGVLQFGTEVVSSADGTIAGMLGASPGASTAADIMIKLLNSAFPSKQQEWAPRLRELVPSLGSPLASDPVGARRSLDETSAVLGLHR